MKNSKYLLLAAIAAATAMVSSCSDNGDLSTPTKEAEGKALVVNPTVDGSRIATTASTGFTSFKLFGFQNPPSTQPLFFNGIDGYVYNGAIGSAWSPTATGAKWPANSDTNSSNFYALSVNGGSSLPSYTGIDLTNIQQGKFSYTAPTTAGGDVDLSKQEDILVASSLNALQSDNNGVLNLPFTHAFAKLTMQLRFNSYESGNTTGNVTDGFHFTITSIILHNVKLNGEYNYTSGWTASDKGDITFTYATPVDFTAQHLNGTDNIFRDLINEASSILVVPQQFTEWWVSDGRKEATDSKALSTVVDAPYVEIMGWVWDETETRRGMSEELGWSDEDIENIFTTYSDPSKYNLDDDSEIFDGYDAVGMLGLYTMPVANPNTLGPGSVYFPFPSTLVLEANKKYNIRLNIYKGYNNLGKYVLNAAGQV